MKPLPPYLEATRRGVLVAVLVAGALLAVHAAPAQPPKTVFHDALTVDVVVVGAGMAGVTAAGVLASAGNVSFVVLEATNRTGGRLIARQFGSPAVKQIVVEAGGNWVHGIDDRHLNPLWPLIKQTQLVAGVVPGSTSNLSLYAVYRSDGSRVSDAYLNAACAEFARAYTCANVTGATLAPGADYDMHDGLVRCGWVRTSELAQLLEWEGTASDASIPAPAMSLRFNLPDGTYSWFGADDHFVLDQRPRGYATLVDAAGGPDFSDPLTDARMRFGEVVTGIDTACDAVTVTTAAGTVVRARRAIVTIPMAVLGLRYAELFTTTPLPADTAAAMALRSRGNFTKIFVQWPTVFWDDSVKDFLSATHLPGFDGPVFAEFHNLNHAQNHPGSQAMLMAVVNPLSVFIEQASDEVVMGVVMRWFEQMFPDAAIPVPSDFFVARHGVDPLAMCSYSTVPFGYTEEMFAASIRPLTPAGCPSSAPADLPTVLWAGEAACRAFNGYVHSAYISGQSAAQQALEAFGFAPAPLSLCDMPVNQG